MTTSVKTTVRTSVSTVRNVDVNADCAPTTSLFSRLMSDPVWVRAKKAIGSCCTWSNSDRRMPAIMRSPTRAPSQRMPTPRRAEPRASATTIRARTLISPRCCFETTSSTMRLNTSGGSTPKNDVMTASTRYAVMSARNTRAKDHARRRVSRSSFFDLVASSSMWGWNGRTPHFPTAEAFRRPWRVSLPVSVSPPVEGFAAREAFRRR